MIKFMRGIAPIVMWVVIVAFIGTIFFAWGMDFTQRNKSEMFIGKIGKEKIPLRSFSQKVEVERERYRMNAENNEISPQQNRMVPRQVWETMVSKAVHDKVFKEMSLGGSADEVFEHIKKNPPPEIMQHPSFQTDSMFDTAKYIQFLSTPESFDNPGMLELEMYTKNLIVPMEKLRRLIEASVWPTKVEIEYAYRAEKDKAVFEFVKAAASSFPVDSSDITGAMIESYYKAHQDTFKEVEQAELYFVKIPKVATHEDEMVFLRELNEIKERIQNKESTFEEEAQIESDDEGSAKNGGDLGWFGKGQMVPAFESVAFSLPPGSVSDPIKTSFGYHLIYVEGKEMQDGVEKVHARHILRKILPTAETLDSLETVVEDLRKNMLEKGAREACALYKNITLDSTGLFRKNDMIRGIGTLPGAATFAFSNKEEQEEVSERLENDDALFLLKLKRKTPAGILPLADARERIFWSLKDSIQNVRAKTHLENLRSSLTDGSDLTNLKDQDPLLSSGITDTVSRKQYVPEVGYNNAAIAVALKIPLNSISKVIKTDGSYFLVKPVWANTASEIPWESSDVTRIKSSLIDEGRKNIYMAWYTSYRKNLDIEDKLDTYFE